MRVAYSGFGLQIYALIVLNYPDSQQSIPKAQHTEHPYANTPSQALYGHHATAHSHQPTVFHGNDLQELAKRELQKVVSVCMCFYNVI